MAVLRRPLPGASRGQGAATGGHLWLQRGRLGAAARWPHRELGGQDGAADRFTHPSFSFRPDSEEPSVYSLDPLHNSVLLVKITVYKHCKTLFRRFVSFRIFESQLRRFFEIAR